MFKLSDYKQKKTTYTGIKAGYYLAEIVAVVDNENYVKGDAFIVKYLLNNLDGSYAGKFEETFLNDISNYRTSKLADLMSKLGIDNTDDLVGITIRVEIKYRVVSHSCSLPSIINHEPITGTDLPFSDLPKEEK